MQIKIIKILVGSNLKSPLLPHRLSQTPEKYTKIIVAYHQTRNGDVIRVVGQVHGFMAILNPSARMFMYILLCKVIFIEDIYYNLIKTLIFKWYVNIVQVRFFYKERYFRRYL